MVRILAWKILRTSETPLRAVDRAAQNHELDGRDRGLLRRLIATEVRRRATLRAIVRHYSRGKPAPELATHLHLGVAQVLFLDQVPDHAAVSETVGAVGRTLGQSKSKYANALLRAVIRDRAAGHCGDERSDLIGRDLHLKEPVFRDPETHPLLWAEDALSIPAPLYKRWTKRFGEETARRVATAMLDEVPLSVRVVRGSREELTAELADLELTPRLGGHPDVLLFPTSQTETVVRSDAFREGRITVQGETALRAAELVEAREDERVLDLCAAPGGKTAVLAGRGARVLAVDVNETRVERIRAGLERLGLAERVETRVSDGTAAVHEDFDAVLVDAPCSNTGVLGARPGARWRFGPASQRSLGEIQGRLLTEGAARVRPGGRLVYSTCSLEPDENGQRVRGFLESAPGWRLDAEHEWLPDPAGEAGPVDGGYAARLVRDA